MKIPGGSVKRVLVVEDEPAISDVCRRVLIGEGFEVDIAVNRKVAQGVIDEQQYDLCLIDIRTPAMNGMELYQWLEEKHLKVANGVIFTTGDVMSGDVKDFLEQTGRPYLPKPFTPDEIRSIVRENVREVK
jgi:DNA-binding response OmpR family regulator